VTVKKRQRRKDARPDEIIAAALLEFAEKGYAGTSIGSIAKRADIARSTVYLYFDDKEALIRQAFEDRIGSIFANMQTGVMPVDAPFEAAFRGMLQTIYSRMIKPDNLVLLKVLIAEGALFPELTAYYHANILKKGESVITMLISQAIDRGEVRPEVGDFDLKIIIAPVMVAAMWQLTFQKIEPLDLPRYIEGHVEMLKLGILV
jgi:AcrR family transcriptional regulator